MLKIYDKRYINLIHSIMIIMMTGLVVVYLVGKLFQISGLCIVCLCTVVFLMGVACILAVLFFFYRQEQRLEEATQKITDFMKGDSTIRLDSCEEGAMAKFFEEINHMALSLHTHLEREKDGKDFLKGLISDISHQLKTPITAIRMYNEIIADERDNPKTVVDFTAKTELSLNRMECLIQNLLKIARLDAGTIVLEKKTFEAEILLDEVAEEFITTAGREGKNIHTKSDGEVNLHADRNWTAECIRNLLKNSLSHMKEGDTVELSCVRTPVFVRVIVKDDGEGIHPEDLHHIFKRFYRSRFSQDTQGVGLGLALVKSIVEAHGGTVSVESKLGEGSSFTLDFPIETVQVN